VQVEIASQLYVGRVQGIETGVIAADARISEILTTERHQQRGDAQTETVFRH
jgi:hypothetical protein